MRSNQQHGVITTITIFALPNVFSADMQHLIEMSRDFQHKFALSQLAVVAPTSEMFSVENISAAYLPADRSEDTLIEIGRLVEDHMVDLVAFLGVQNETFIDEVNTRTSLFRSNVHSLLPMSSSRKLKLRLDSNVYLYTPEYEILEQYSVKSGPVLTQAVGHWSPNEGLVVPKLHKWQRRTLGGIELTTGLIPWSLFNRGGQYDADGGIVNLTGIFPEVLRLVNVWCMENAVFFKK